MSDTLTEIMTRFTHPHNRANRVTDPITGMSETITHPHGPLADLLEKLITEKRRQAVTAAIQGSTVPLASDAEQLAREIKTALQADALRHTHRIQVPATLSQQITTWHQLWASYERAPGEEAAWAQQFTVWEEQILQLLNPGTEMVALHEPCPVCGQDRVTVEGDSKTAVVVAYHPDAPAATCQLICRACGPVATGVHAASAALRITRLDACGTPRKTG